MITGKSLSPEELKFLCRTVIRLHKENGCLKELKNVYTTSKKLHESISVYDRCLCEFLIGPVWKIVYSYHRGVNDEDKLSVITASIEMLKFVDTIYNSKYSIFRALSAELVEQEYSYIKSTIDDIVDADGSLNKTIPMETIEELKHFYEKLKHLTQIKIDLF